MDDRHSGDETGHSLRFQIRTGSLHRAERHDPSQEESVREPDELFEPVLGNDAKVIDIVDLRSDLPEPD